MADDRITDLETARQVRDAARQAGAEADDAGVLTFRNKLEIALPPQDHRVTVDLTGPRMASALIMGFIGGIAGAALVLLVLA